MTLREVGIEGQVTSTSELQLGSAVTVTLASASVAERKIAFTLG